MKNKKGFAFVERIVALTVLYTSFINLLDRQRTNAENDHPGDKYAMYYIKQEWVKKSLSSFNTNCPDNLGDDCNQNNCNPLYDLSVNKSFNLYGLN